MYNYIFKLLFFTVHVRAQYGQWWEAMASQPAELQLSNGIFTGRMIDFDGTNVEIFRGKLKQEKLS